MCRAWVLQGGQKVGPQTYGHNSVKSARRDGSLSIDFTKEVSSDFFKIGSGLTESRSRVRGLTFLAHPVYVDVVLSHWRADLLSSGLEQTSQTADVLNETSTN